ncbi:MAG: SHOCT domain-containing protein [Planctomycetes bacterium]|nr:SHOCT domain-containing protein [Planctomycetota bacterium]
MDCQITPENRRRTLHQPWGWGGVAQFELSEKALHVRTEGFFTIQETTLPMHAIEPHPVMVRDFDRSWAIGAALCWMVASVLVMLRFEVAATTGAPLTFAAAAVGAGAAAIVTTAIALHSARHVIIFHHRYSGGPAVILDATRPSPESVEAFAAELDRFAHECDGPGSGDRDLSLADELKKLARLNAEGALTDEEFLRAKAQLLEPDERGSGGGGSWEGG